VARSAFEDAGRDKIDVMTNKAPPPLRPVEILGSEMICVMSADHRFGAGISP
jgi:hypothetical protein